MATLKEARRIIAQLATGSFLQLTEPVFAEIKKHHAKFTKYFPNQRGFHAMVNLLLQTMSDPGIQADQKGVRKIIGVIDELIESIFAVLKEETKTENARQ